MAITNVSSTSASITATAPATSNKVALTVVTTLFFMWGFITVLNDVLVPHLKSIFDLSYARVMLIQFAFFTAYFSRTLRVCPQRLRQVTSRSTGAAPW